MWPFTRLPPVLISVQEENLTPVFYFQCNSSSLFPKPSEACDIVPVIRRRKLRLREGEAVCWAFLQEGVGVGDGSRMLSPAGLCLW